jgi:4-hydroxyphenylpyruvate dioxygenase
LLHSIATVSISGNLEDKLQSIAAAGFSGVEIFENDLLTFPGSATDIAKLMNDLGLICTAFQPFRDFEGMPDNLREKTFNRLERKFEIMKQLGAKVILVCSNVSRDSLNDKDRIIEDFIEAGELARKHNLTIGYEGLAWGRHVWDHRDIWDIVRRVDHPNVGIILDSFHSLVRKVPTESLLDIDPKKILLVQLADAPLLDMDSLYWSRHFRCMPGQGDLPLVNYVETLDKIGYDGPLSLEIFNDRFRSASSSQVALDGRRSLLYLEDQVSRKQGHKISPSWVKCEGISFIEFSANEEEAQQLEALFRGLGFVHAGQHKSKSVSRWHQGDINLLINIDENGFARSHNEVHGCSVCAIGLKVEDAGLAFQRAKKYLITAFSQSIAEGEYEIPAIKGVGGMLFYFVDKKEHADIWQNDFNNLDNSTRTHRLDSVDHIAQSMIFEEMLSCLLYYLVLFDVKKTAQLEITDPLGVIQSQAVENPGRKLRLTMNSSVALQTMPSRLLSTYMGAGVQHIAFACENIFFAAEQALLSGLALLKIPDLYYDDLEAKFDFEKNTLDRMRKLNILYDKDDVGSYWQFYTQVFADRFFFEVVQRQNYDGYGAVNTAIRLAAQSRE